MHISKFIKVGMVAAMAAMMVFSLGVPVFATTGEDGPTPAKQGDPGSTPFPEVQVLSVELTTGTFNLDPDGAGGCTEQTGIAYNATDLAVKAAIETCAGYTVTVSRTNTAAGYYYKVVFTAPGGPLPEMTSSTTGVTVRTEQNGNDTGWAQPDGIAGPGTVTVTETVAPHGGYSSLTDYCLQCHSVHNAPNEFALLRDSSVTATCQTCHSLFANNPTGAFDSNFVTGENTRAMGSAASRSAYDLGDGGLFPTADAGDIVRGHQIGGTGGGATGDYSLTDGEITLYEYDSYRRNSEAVLGTSFPSTEVSGAAQDGIYCASCHTPHGNFGQVVNKWVETDPVRVGTANMTANDADIVVTFDSGGNYPTGFGSGQRKAAVWFDVNGNGTPGVGDFFSIIANQFRSQGTTTASSAGYVNEWASCLWNPAAGASQNLCIGDLAPATAANVPMYLGNEGMLAGSSRVDYNGTTGTWQSIASTLEATVGDGVTGTPSDYTTTDAEGQTVYMFAYKMLSSGPNHQMAAPNVKNYAVSSGATNEWCGTCHPLRFDDGSGLHPTHSAGGGCTACHGNPADGTSYDYPHTSTVTRLLKQLPDGLCVTCHTNLP